MHGDRGTGAGSELPPGPTASAAVSHTEMAVASIVALYLSLHINYSCLQLASTV